MSYQVTLKCSKKLDTKKKYIFRESLYDPNNKFQFLNFLSWID